jgi:hypothetical protein
MRMLVAEYGEPVESWAERENWNSYFEKYLPQDHFVRKIPH